MGHGEHWEQRKWPRGSACKGVQRRPAADRVACFPAKLGRVLWTGAPRRLSPGGDSVPFVNFQGGYEIKKTSRESPGRHEGEQ